MRAEFWRLYGYVTHGGEEKVTLWYRDNNKYKFVNETKGNESKVYRVLFGSNTKWKFKKHRTYISKKLNKRMEEFMKDVK